jgi:ubiquinone/menaquinone biosynthesis C-methylase UbiE
MSKASDHAVKDIEYHEQIASQYDRVVVEPRWSSIDALFRPVRHHLPDRRGSMLDVGTGTGHMLRRFATYFDTVVAVDHSTAMLAVARDTARRNRLDNIEFVVSDAQRFLSSASGKFDLVTCVGFLHHLQPADLADLLTAARQVLAPQGVLLLSEPIAIDRPEPRAIARWNDVYRRDPQVYAQAHEDPDEAPLELSTLKRALSAAGLGVFAEGSGWEIFPRHAPERWSDRVAIRVLHALFGRHGPVYWACCKADGARN